MWLPYVSDIDVKKDTLKVVYKGGECTEPWSSIHSILLYGSTCPLSEAFMEKCRAYRIPVCIHRRNVSDAIWITPSIRGNADDLITKQILFRTNEKKRVHVAKQLLDAKFKGMKWLQPYPMHFRGFQNVETMRTIEAWHANEYWKKYYAALGFGDTSRRRKNNAVTSALDAVSKLIAGVTLRWITYHRMSPTHAFLHEPTEYISLCYDLMEPHRGYTDKAVFDALMKATENNVPEDMWVGRAITAVEDLLDSTVYTEATRQLATMQELNHGCVLALRAYLTGDAVRFMPPLPGKPNGGRPRIAGYKLFGRSAGPTDFWETARRVSTS